ncbi:MAG: diguanylate cyclase [Acidobacteriia bacterium]|nr:diguanylate cyclase [Terriglobia bacterium]
MRSFHSVRGPLATTLSLVVLVGLAYQLRVGRLSAGRRVGIQVQPAAGGLMTAEVAPGLPAQRAGVHPGDLLVTVNGIAVADTEGYDRIADRFHSGEPVKYHVLRKGQPLDIEVRPGTPFDWFDYLLNTVTTLCFLAVGLLALLQRFDDLRARLLFLFSTAVAFELALPGLSVGYPGLGFFRNLGFYALTGFQLGVELHLASILPARPDWMQRQRWVVPTYYSIGVATALVALLPLFSESFLSSKALPWSFDVAEELVNNYVLPFWATAVVMILATQAVRFPEPEGRQQAGLVLLGVLPWAGIVYWTTALALLAKPRPEWLDSLWSPLLLCYPVTIFVAIYRYHLFDIELIVRRSLVYTALTGTLVLAFYAGLGVGGALVSGLIGGGRNTVWVIAGATLALGMLFAPLRSFLQRLIDRSFFPERYALRHRLINLAGDLAAQGRLPAMGRYLVERLCEVFAVRNATLLLAEPKGELLLTLASSSVDSKRDFDQSFLLSSHDPGVEFLRRMRRPVAASTLKTKSSSFHQRLEFFGAALAVPLMVRDRVTGLLLVGEKESGHRHPAEEIELLNLFSHNVATVLENAHLFQSATYESLTGLMRRETILEQLDRELERARRYSRPLTVGMADLDNFKEVNDTHGHLVGDALLKMVAQALADGLRGSDWVGRYGGDEFLFLLPETNIDGAVVVTEKMCKLVEQVGLVTNEGATAAVTVSVGLGSIADLDLTARPTVEALIGVADRNLLRAKSQGRNRIEPSRTGS